MDHVPVPPPPPMISLIQQHPSFSAYELWDFLGDQGIFSESPAHLLSAFDVLVHRQGTLYYRMRRIKDRKPVEPLPEGAVRNVLFAGTIFHDPMGYFVRRSESGSRVNVSNCYVQRADEHGERDEHILENDHDISLEEFQALGLV